jgi:hypothetical protein
MRNETHETIGLEMKKAKETKTTERENVRNRIIEKINAKQKMRTKKKNQLVSAEWFVPPLKGDRLCGGCNISSIIVRQRDASPEIQLLDVGHK